MSWVSYVTCTSTRRRQYNLFRKLNVSVEILSQETSYILFRFPDPGVQIYKADFSTLQHTDVA